MARWADLELARSALASAPMASTNDFRTRVLSENDATQGTASGAAALSFCRRRGIQSGQIRFNINRYGSDTCGILARAWCHKMQWYYNVELLSPEGEATVFSPDHHSAYLEPTEFQHLVAHDTRPFLVERVTQIRNLFH